MKNKTKVKDKVKKKETPTISNRKAFAEFEIIETLVAGIILTGTEIKSLRLGRGKLNEAFAKIDKNCEMYLYGMNIPKYECGNRYNHEPDRIRKLLLNKKEILKWKSKAERENLTIIGLKLFFRGQWAKIEIALCKRKLLHDKRKELKQKAIDRDTERDLKRY